MHTEKDIAAARKLLDDMVKAGVIVDYRVQPKNGKLTAYATLPAAVRTITAQIRIEVPE
jgi:hypothetical protein